MYKIEHLTDFKEKENGEHLVLLDSGVDVMNYDSPYSYSHGTAEVFQ